MAIRNRVSLFKRYLDDRLLSVDVFKTYYLIMEGTNTEPIYFKHIERKLSELKIHNNIRLVFIDRILRDRGSNTPEQLLNFMLEYKKDINDENAVFWLVFDRDSYKTHLDPTNSYLEFLKTAKAKDISLLITSPCFEIWLLLHRENAYNNYLKNIETKIFKNDRISPGFTYTSKLVKKLYGYNPKVTIPYKIINELDQALEEADNLTHDSEKMAYVIGENISEFIKTLLIDPRS